MEARGSIKFLVFSLRPSLLRKASYPSDQSKDYGFAEFHNEEPTQKAIEQLNGMLLNDKQVRVGKQERGISSSKTNFSNVGDAARTVVSLNGKKFDDKERLLKYLKGRLN
ncbi:hypothetical protein GQ457_05G019890 [Hibiscus cannabinus]